MPFSLVSPDGMYVYCRYPLDCEQSLFYFGIMEGSARFAIARLRAASGEASSREERGRRPEK